MKEMTFIHDGETQQVIYIEYRGELPHEVIADHDGYQHHWDFEPDCKGIEKLMFYCSGFGGSTKDLQAPKWAYGHKGEYWLHPEAKFKDRPRNARRLDAPKSITDEFGGAMNPFEKGRQIGGVEYCKICNRYYDEDCCPHHHSFNEQGEIVYPDGSKQD